MSLPYKKIPVRIVSEKQDDFSASFPEKIKALSWNLLAPCWKRTSYGREGGRSSVWKNRLEETIQRMIALDCDLICIQELWFDDEYLSIFCNGLSDKYVIYALQRVHSKPDGLAILLKKNTFPKPDTYGFDFHDFGSRVGMMVSWEDVLLFNTHLTFPHKNQYDSTLRMTQVEDIIDILQHHAKKQQLVVGDFNGSIFDEAVSVLIEQASIIPMLEHDDFVTHLSHRGDKMACDLFFARTPCFSEIHIHPLELELSDHAIIEVLINIRTKR